MDDCTYLTGRLRISLDTGGPEIDRLGSGAELLDARCNLRGADREMDCRPARQESHPGGLCFCGWEFHGEPVVGIRHVRGRRF